MTMMMILFCEKVHRNYGFSVKHSHIVPFQFIFFFLFFISSVNVFFPISLSAFVFIPSFCFYIFHLHSQQCIRLWHMHTQYKKKYKSKFHRSMCIITVLRYDVYVYAVLDSIVQFSIDTMKHCRRLKPIKTNQK